MSVAENCTGLRMSKPASTKWGISGISAPQEWMNVFHAVWLWIQSLTARWNGWYRSR